VSRHLPAKRGWGSVDLTGMPVLRRVIWAVCAIDSSTEVVSVTVAQKVEPSVLGSRAVVKLVKDHSGRIVVALNAPLSEFADGCVLTEKHLVRVHAKRFTQTSLAPHVAFAELHKMGSLCKEAVAGHVAATVTLATIATTVTSVYGVTLDATDYVLTDTKRVFRALFSRYTTRGRGVPRKKCPEDSPNRSTSG
jgi:hypothetical protein